MSPHLKKTLFLKRPFVPLGFALLGMAGPWMPWGLVSFGSLGRHFGSGLYFFEGWLAFLSMALASVIFVGALAGRGDRIVLFRISGWAGAGCLLSCLVYLIRYGFGHTGAGIWCCVIASVPVLISGLLLQGDPKGHMPGGHHVPADPLNGQS